EEYAKREDEAIAKLRADYEKAVAEGDPIYCSQARGEGYGGGYRKPVPPPKTREVPVLDDEGNKQYVEKTVSAVDGRVFRSNFYAAFTPRMRGRLWETRRAVERDMGINVESGSETALAVRDKKEEVKRAGEEQRAKVVHMGTYRSSAESGYQYDDT